MYLIAQKFPELAEFKPISKRIDIEFIKKTNTTASSGL